MESIRGVGHRISDIFHSVPKGWIDDARAASFSSRRFWILLLGPKTTEEIFGAWNDRILEGRPLSDRLDEVKSNYERLESLALLVRIKMGVPPLLFLLTLASLPLKATFIAAVQATILQISVANNSTWLEVVTNAVSFASLMLDILGVVGCLHISRTLRNAVKIMGSIIDTQAVLDTERDHEAGADIGTPFPDILTTRDTQSSAHLNSTQSTTQLQSKLIESLRAFKYRQMIPRAAFVTGIIGYGGIGLVGSILCLSIATQPRAVWITTVVTIGYTGFSALWLDIMTGIGSTEDPPHDVTAVDSIKGAIAHSSPLSI